jgi:hypothetical protein
LPRDRDSKSAPILSQTVGPGSLCGAGRRSGKAWQQVIAPLGAFSEYVLYGLDSHRILGNSSVVISAKSKTPVEDIRRVFG